MSLIENAIKEKAFPGCQVLISKDKNIFFHKSYGYHTYKQNHQVNNNDVYDLASITKNSINCTNTYENDR